jgi:hypothetical protein
MRVKRNDSKKRYLAIVLAMLFYLLIITLFSCDKKSQNITGGTNKESPTDNNVKLKSFLSKKGIMYIKDFYYIGSFTGKYGKMDVQAAIMYQPNKDIEKIEKIRGILINIEGGSNQYDKHQSVLDLDEAESVSKAISYMIEEYLKRQALTSSDIKSDYNEVVFVTKDEFKVGFYQRKDSLQAFASSGDISKASCFFSVGGLGELKRYIDEGIISAKK